MNDPHISNTLRNCKFAKSFPNLEQEGCYNQIMLMINLPDLTKLEMDEILNTGITIDNYLAAGTIKHEQTHFIDHISTLHGQKNIVLLFNAIHAYLEKNVEEYWRIRTLLQHNKRDLFGDYFTETYLDHESSSREPWLHQISSGKRFDFEGKLSSEMPLLFVRFNKSDGTPLARTPLSVAAIHETNAIYEELKLKQTFINSLQDQNLRADEHEEMTRDAETILYSTDFALYSAMAHIVAKTNFLSDVFEIYNLSSSLGILALNLTPEDISGINIKLINDLEWDNRFKAMAHNGDIGYAFYRLNENLIDHFGTNNYTLENVLQASNLPTQNELELKVMEAMSFNLYELKSGPFYGLAQHLLNLGMEIYSKRGLDGRKEGYDKWLNENNHFPHIIFSDTKFDPNNINLQTAINNLGSNDGEGCLEDHYKVFAYFKEKFIEFNEVCGI